MSVETDINLLIERARAAQQIIECYTQEQVDELVRAMVWSVARAGAAEKIAELAVEETRLGNYEGKLSKMAVKCRAALADIIRDKSVGVIEEDRRPLTTPKILPADQELFGAVMSKIAAA